ncbi:MAG: L,D-transpeptidase [Chloroflexota bacterium]
MFRRVRLLFAVVSLLALFAVAAPPAITTHAAATHAVGKRITISLSRERLRAWDGNRVVLSTPITSGDRLLPTPTGIYTVFAKRSPYTFVSPWPRSSRFWYPNSTVSFALEFRGGGYFIHDAPWRGVYGHGSNSGTQPGTDYGGTHGCVNVPYNAARFLYFWAPMGTRVHIVR